MEVHFIDVGCGNMSLIIMPNGSKLIYDCNITEDNKDRVLKYINKIIGVGTNIDIFITSHRDADHMRGIDLLHKSHPILKIWDTDVPGTSTESPEYITYMNLRRNVTSSIIETRKYWDFDDAILRCMNAKWDDYTDVNEQSVVLKIEYKRESVMLTGDTNYRPWKEKILTFYSDETIKSSILLAAHHGSITFFDDPSDKNNYYIAHIKKIKPAMTIVSVGPNSFGLPDKKAIEIYENNSSGSSQGDKVFSTDGKGTIKLILKEEGGWALSPNQN